MAIYTIPLWKSTQCGALGTAGTLLSDPIEVKGINAMGTASLTYAIAGTGATAGSSTFQYLVSPERDGTYRAAGTFGTHGATPETDIIQFTLTPAPWVKVKAVSGTSAPLVLTAELNIIG
jgi:hypothetical protein